MLNGKYLKKVVCELGGSDGYLILDGPKDELKSVAEMLVESRLMLTGQVCVSPKRLITLKQQKQLFLSHIVDTVKQKKFMQHYHTLARPAIKEMLVSQVRRAIEAGAVVAYGDPEGGNVADHLDDNLRQKIKEWNEESGSNLDQSEWLEAVNDSFFNPVVLTNVKKGNPAYEEELFGPVFILIDGDCFPFAFPSELPLLHVALFITLFSNPPHSTITTFFSDCKAITFLIALLSFDSPVFQPMFQHCKLVTSVILHFLAEDEEDAIEISNDSIFGLGGGVYCNTGNKASTEDEPMQHAVEIAKKLDTGMVRVQFQESPSVPEGHKPAFSGIGSFGGVKASGIGRTGGKWGLMEWVNIKNVIYPGQAIANRDATFKGH